MTPTTEAGRRLAKALAYLRDPGSYEPGDRYVEDVRAIAAIEAEAREQGILDAWDRGRAAGAIEERACIRARLLTLDLDTDRDRELVRRAFIDRSEP